MTLEAYSLGMRPRGVVFALGVVAAVLVLASAAGASGSPVKVVVASRATPDCTGFVVESLSGAAIRCIPFDPGAWPAAPSAVAADDSVALDYGPDPFMEGGLPVWLVHPNGSAVELDSSQGDGEVSMSADGSKVAFLRTPWNTDTRAIYVINADGSGLRLVASGTVEGLDGPAISPDGGSIAYWCRPVNPPPARGCGPLPDGSYRQSGLMLMNADGTDKRMIVIGPTGLSGASWSPGWPLSWSPDGRWLTTQGLTPGGTTQVFAYRTDGSDLFKYADPTRQVTHLRSAPSVSGQFCGSSSHILYLSNDSRYAYLINRDGSHRQRTTLNELQTGDPICVPPAGAGGPATTVNAMRVTVPNVGTLTYTDAKRRLQHAGLHVGKVKRVFSARIRRGYVIAQYPRAGAHVHRSTKQGPPVKLVLSRGPRT